MLSNIEDKIFLWNTLKTKFYTNWRRKRHRHPANRNQIFFKLLKSVDPCFPNRGQKVIVHTYFVTDVYEGFFWYHTLRHKGWQPLYFSISYTQYFLSSQCIKTATRFYIFYCQKDKYFVQEMHNRVQRIVKIHKNTEMTYLCFYKNLQCFMYETSCKIIGFFYISQSLFWHSPETDLPIFFKFYICIQ